MLLALAFGWQGCAPERLTQMRSFSRWTVRTGEKGVGAVRPVGRRQSDRRSRLCGIGSPIPSNETETFLGEGPWPAWEDGFDMVLICL